MALNTYPRILAAKIQIAAYAANAEQSMHQIFREHNAK
jgi:hypothetical protein